MVDAHQLLHDLGGDGDLAAGDGPEPRLPQRAQRLLRRVGVVERPGRDRLGQVLVARAGAVRLVEEASGFCGGEHGRASRAVAWPSGVGRFPDRLSPAPPVGYDRASTLPAKAPASPAREEPACSRPPSPAACRSPPGSPSPTSCGRRGGSTAPRSSDAKRDATLLALKEQEDAGIDIVGDGEQSRQHFVHGFLERVEGIDFAHKVEMGIRDDRYKAMVPQVVGPLRLKGRVHASEAQLARAHTKTQAEVHPARPDDDRRHHRRPPLRRQGEDGDGLRRAAQPGGARAGDGRRRRHPVRRAGLQRLHGRGDGVGHRRAGARRRRASRARPPCTSATATASRPTSTGRRRSAASGASTRRSSRRSPRAGSTRCRSSAATRRCR